MSKEKKFILKNRIYIFLIIYKNAMNKQKIVKK